MAIHPTARSQWAQARLLGWLKGLSLTGAPPVFASIEPGRSAQATPAIRISFEELPGVDLGRASATQSATGMALLIIADLFWPHPKTVAPADLVLYQHLTVADELREALSFTALSFLDYTTPTSPVTVDGAAIRTTRAETRRIPVPESADYRRVQIRVTAEWIGRFDDFNA